MVKVLDAMTRREVMSFAWTLCRQGRTINPHLGFGHYLRQAWCEARRRAYEAARAARPNANAIAAVEGRIADLQTKDRWSRADYAAMDALRAQRAAL